MQSFGILRLAYSIHIGKNTYWQDLRTIVAHICCSFFRSDPVCVGAMFHKFHNTNLSNSPKYDVCYRFASQNTVLLLKNKLCN